MLALIEGHQERIVETSTQQRLFGIEGASERTGLPAGRIYSEIATSRLPCKRVGRRIYFSEADILAYLQRIQQNGTE
jgi:predicted DNA-binding transcriptional regulator AlpA